MTDSANLKERARHTAKAMRATHWGEAGSIGRHALIGAALGILDEIAALSITKPRAKRAGDKGPLTLYEAMRDDNRPRCATCNNYDADREIGSVCSNCQQQGGT